MFLLSGAFPVDVYVAERLASKLLQEAYPLFSSDNHTTDTVGNFILLFPIVVNVVVEVLQVNCLSTQFPNVFLPKPCKTWVVLSAWCLPNRCEFMATTFLFPSIICPHNPHRMHHIGCSNLRSDSMVIGPWTSPNSPILSS